LFKGIKSGGVVFLDKILKLNKKPEELKMINVVNNELFKFETQKCDSEHGEYFKTLILSSITSINSEIPSRIVTVTSSSQNYNDNKTAVAVRLTGNNNVNVLVKSNERNKYNSDVFLVAFPFNGIAAPILESKAFRIHKGTIVVSDKKNIPFRGTTYKKILYLVVEPNMHLFDSTNRIKPSEIDFSLTSYNLFTGSDKKTVTIKETMKIGIAEDGFDVSWTEAECAPIDKNAFGTTPLFVRYEKAEKVAAPATNRIPYTKPAYQKSNDTKKNAYAGKGKSSLGNKSNTSNKPYTGTNYRKNEPTK